MDAQLFSSRAFSRIYNLLYPTFGVKVASFLFIVALLISGTLIVVLTGGTHFAYLHLFYIPIILSGFLYSVFGGLSVALISGFVLGPLMPNDISLGTPQPLSSWVLRIFFFTTVGGLSGLGSSLFRSYIRELEAKVTIDPLTQLYSLGGLLKVFKEKILPGKIPLNVVILEIFYLDEIDQAFGPHGRNELILMIKERLQSFLSKQIDLGFVDTKSFCLLVPERLNITKILSLCRQELSGAYMIEDIPMFVEFHYGISRFPEDGETLDTLIRKAKIAVVRSEKFLQDQAFYTQEETNKTEKNVKILHSLRQAIENKSLSLHFQPKIDLKTDKPLGFEALARWSHPTLGRIGPDVFIPLTERTLLIGPFTRWLLEEAVSQAKKWHDRGVPQTVAVNFSMKNFLDPDIVNFVFSTLKKYQFPHEYLEIEVTESSIAQNISMASDIMRALREQGIKISVDDFGTGQSSLQYLFKLPLDILKIDRAFVSSMAKNSGAAAIVRSSILLGHELNLQVIAEGAETAEEVEMLRKFGCDAVQGYYFSAPMEVHEATDWLYTALHLQVPSSRTIRTVP